MSLMDHCVGFTRYPVEKKRQDRAVCMDCDWSVGWDLDWERIYLLAIEHLEATAHAVDYREQFIDQATTGYLLKEKP